MDQVDRAILAELQADGRLTVTELADRVRLTPGPCHRRLRELERSGVITGYRALVNPAAVGLGFEALVQITLERGTPAPSPPSKRPWPSCPRSGMQSAYSATPTTCCGSPRETSTASRHCGTGNWPRCQVYTASPQPS